MKALWDLSRAVQMLSWFRIPSGVRAEERRGVRQGLPLSRKYVASVL